MGRSGVRSIASSGAGLTKSISRIPSINREPLSSSTFFYAATTLTCYSTLHPALRSPQLPIKAFGVSSIATFALIIGADKYSRKYEISQWEKGGGSERTEEGLERRVGIQEGAAHAKPVNTMDRVLEWAKVSFPVDAFALD